MKGDAGALGPTGPRGFPGADGRKGWYRKPVMFEYFNAYSLNTLLITCFVNVQASKV